VAPSEDRQGPGPHPYHHFSLIAREALPND